MRGDGAASEWTRPRRWARFVASGGTDRGRVAPALRSHPPGSCAGDTDAVTTQPAERTSAWMLGGTSASAIFSAGPIIAIEAAIAAMPGDFAARLAWVMGIPATVIAVMLVATLVALHRRARRFGGVPVPWELVRGSVLVGLAAALACVTAPITHQPWPAFLAALVCIGMSTIWRPHTRAVAALDAHTRAGVPADPR